MPIYEYRCQSCGHHLEKLQRLGDAPLRDCPSCGEAELSRLVSAAGFRLKGAGWYETDFKKGGKKNLHETASGADSGGPSPDSSAAPAPAKTAEPKADEKKPASGKTDAA